MTNVDLDLVFKPTTKIPKTTNFYQTKIEGLFYIENQIFFDERGFFTELAHTQLIEKITNKKFKIEQINLSFSHTKVIRGFHAEGWNKLVSVLSGISYCVLVDLRSDSPTFLQKEYFLLGDEDCSLPTLSGCLFIPQGVGNSICAIQGPVRYMYAVDALYANRDQSLDKAVNLFDAKLDIKWPFEKDELIISERDQNAGSLDELTSLIASKIKTGKLKVKK